MRPFNGPHQAHCEPVQRQLTGGLTLSNSLHIDPAKLGKSEVIRGLDRLGTLDWASVGGDDRAAPSLASQLALDHLGAEWFRFSSRWEELAVHVVLGLLFAWVHSKQGKYLASSEFLAALKQDSELVSLKTVILVCLPTDLQHDDTSAAKDVFINEVRDMASELATATGKLARWDVSVGAVPAWRYLLQGILVRRLQEWVRRAR